MDLGMVSVGIIVLFQTQACTIYDHVHAHSNAHRKWHKNKKKVIAVFLVLLTKRMDSESLGTVWYLHDLLEKDCFGLLYRVKLCPWDKRL